MSGADDGRDVFEEGLGDALRRTGDGFSADGPALIDGGVLRGRRRLRRRRTGMVTASVAAMAVVGLGTSYAAGAFDATGASAQGGGVAAQPGPKEAKKEAAEKKGGKGSGADLSGAQVLRILEGLLPDGEFSGKEGRGTADQLGPLAHLVYDDGHGKAAIGVSVGAVDPDGASVEEQLRCPDKRFVAYDSCTSEKLADGARLMLMRGYEYPDKRAETKLWSAYLVTAEGYTVSASEWNAAAEKDAPVSRPQPPLSTGQLKDLVTSEKWRPVMRAIGTAPDEPLAQPPALGLDKASILKTFKGLLPERVRVTAEGGQESQYAYLVVDDGKGATLLQINVQPDMRDVAGELYGNDAEKLPDGTLVSTRKGPGDGKGGAGIVMWTADTMRKDGFRVVVSAFNSGSQSTDATRPEPALSMDELKSIALSGKWQEK
ncbi:hypothetical protein [Streptomyces sp. KL116D]|uniref:hypothetical protein n=1 Tax=Streptomyces sp. KL116D TaxID=3045152 RepID=UPI003557BE4D